MGADYIYACARVRANEKNLLTHDQLNMMAESKTAEDAMKMLQDAQYGEGGEVQRPSAYERLLLQETERLYRLMKEVAPGEKSFRIFFYPFDYHNIKTLLKAEFLEVDGRGSLMEGGTIDPAAMAVLVKERNYTGMTPHMRKAVEESIDAHARTGDPQSIDLICDRECYADISLEAKKTGNLFVQGYVRLLIDTVNLKTFARARQIRQPWSFFASAFLPGGEISEKTFVAGYEEPLQQFAGRIGTSPLAQAAEEGAAGIRESGSFTVLEKLCDDALIKYIKDAKYISVGIEPLVAYIAAKQMEIKSVRIVMAGKLAGISSELLRERLRETYG